MQIRDWSLEHALESEQRNCVHWECGIFCRWEVYVLSIVDRVSMEKVDLICRVYLRQN